MIGTNSCNNHDENTVAARFFLFALELGDVLGNLRQELKGSFFLFMNFTKSCEYDLAHSARLRAHILLLFSPLSCLSGPGAES